MKTLGQIIREMREDRQMSQLALAHAIGRHGKDAGASISRIESGSITPKLPTLRNIARVLAVEMKTLFPNN